MTISELYDKFKTCSGVSTDTRKIAENSMFLALKGDKFNANEFAKKALESGAKYAVIDEVKYAEDERFLLFDDVLIALQQLANFHRKTFNFPLIGLTGSNGKTTTKELIAAVLSKKYKTYATKGNLNNHIGVPLTLLAINNAYDGELSQIAVIEMGANHQGEIHDLCNICEPTHGLLTNVGKAHLDGFLGFEGVKKGKGELFDFLEKTGGTAFINAKSEIIVEMASTRNFKEKVSYLAVSGEPHNEVVMLNDSPFVSYQFSAISSQQSAVSSHESHISNLTSHIYTHLTGKYNFENIAAALKIGEYFGVDATKANEAIAEYNPDNNRSQIVDKGTNSIILDAYNANPSSMSASIQNFINLKTDKKRVVILGDMLELGDEAPSEHLAIGELIAKGNFDLVVLYGELMKYALPALPKSYYFTDKFSLHNWLIDKALQHSYVLIKGSRGVSLETTVQFL